MKKVDWSTVDSRYLFRTEHDAAEAEIIARMPDTVKIRNHLLVYGSITSLEAWQKYGISRLSAVIYKLRYKKDPPMEIKTEMVYGRDRYGDPVQYGRYYI